MADLSAYRFIQAKLLLNIKELSPLKSISIYYCISMVGSVLTFVSIYLVWTKVFEFPHPMPNNGIIFWFLYYLFFQPLANWCMFPSNVKKHGNSYRKKIISMIIFSNLRVIMAIGYSLIPKLPIVKNENWQWSICILFPLFKKFNMRWNSKFINWAFDCDKEIGIIESIILVEIVHSQSLTIVLASSQISQFITYILIVTDSMISSWFLRSIIRLHRQGTGIANQIRDRKLRNLALKEFLEFLIPIVYCISFVGSYFGPNYEIIGGMGSDMWHHEKVSNLYIKLQKVLTFTFLETFRGLGLGLILWHFFGLNMYNGYSYVITNFGWYILLVGAYSNQIVNGYYLVANFS